MFACKRRPTRNLIENSFVWQKSRRIKQMIYNRYVRLYLLWTHWYSTNKRVIYFYGPSITTIIVAQTARKRSEEKKEKKNTHKSVAVQLLRRHLLPIQLAFCTPRAQHRPDELNGHNENRYFFFSSFAQCSLAIMWIMHISERWCQQKPHAAKQNWQIAIDPTTDQLINRTNKKKNQIPRIVNGAAKRKIDKREI